MKRIVVLLLLIAMLVVSCGGKASNDPKEVATQFVEATYKGDVEALKKLAKKSEAEGFDKAKDSFKEINKMNLKPEITVSSLKEDDEKADVELLVKLKVDGAQNAKEQKVRIHLIIEDGKWVVDTLSQE